MAWWFGHRLQGVVWLLRRSIPLFYGEVGGEAGVRSTVLVGVASGGSRFGETVAGVAPPMGAGARIASWDRLIMMKLPAMKLWRARLRGLRAMVRTPAR